MSNLTTFNQLKTQFNIEYFALKTVSQMNKDLNGLSVNYIDFKPSENNLNTATQQLLPILDELNKTSKLQQFIYQVDLPEKQWLLFINNQDFIFLAHQIIIREAQKVYLREMFKS
jgi:hypothetical protein